MTYPTLTFLAATLTAANFLYQATLGGFHWDVACERSWFQAVAILSVGGIEAARRRL